MIYDIIIPTTDKDLKTLEICIQQCKKHLKFRRIIIISKQNILILQNGLVKIDFHSILKIWNFT